MVDIVVASVLGVASGFVFVAWNVGYQWPSDVIQVALPGLQGLVSGPWFLAAVVGGLVIRKPGAARYTELLAATVSMLVGNQWGATTLISGLVQGLGAEIVFALFLYGSGRVHVAILAGAAAGAAGALNDLVVYYAGVDSAFAVTYVISTAVSGAVIAGALGWLLVKALAKTGALDRFAVGRDVVSEV